MDGHFKTDGTWRGVGFLTSNRAVSRLFQVTADSDPEISFLLHHLQGFTTHVVLVVAVPGTDVHHFTLGSLEH